MPTKKPANLTTQILIDIRNAVQKTNERLDETNARLERLAKAQNQAELHLATELVAVHGALTGLTDEVRGVGGILRSYDVKRLEAFEQRLAAIERKVGVDFALHEINAELELSHAEDNENEACR